MLELLSPVLFKEFISWSISAGVDEDLSVMAV